MMEIKIVTIEIPEGSNVIIGQTHVSKMRKTSKEAISP